MKKTINLTIFFLLINILTVTVFSQQAGLKMLFSITDEKGDFVSGIKTSDIQAMQGKKTVTVTKLEEKKDIPLEVVIIVDASASQERMLPTEKLAGEAFIKSILKPGKDKVAIAKLTGEISFVQALTDNFEQARGQLNKIEFEPPSGYVGGGIMVGKPNINQGQTVKGSTSIWDSIKEVLKSFPIENKQESRRVILLISDGVNTFGEAKLKEAIDASIRNRTSIYAIGIGDSFYEGVDKGTLEKLTGQSGGVLIMPKKKAEDFQIQIKQIESGLRNFYEATFSPDAKSQTDILEEAEIKIINSEFGKRKLRINQPKRF